MWPVKVKHLDRRQSQNRDFNSWLYIRSAKRSGHATQQPKSRLVWINTWNTFHLISAHPCILLDIITIYSYFTTHGYSISWFSRCRITMSRFFPLLADPNCTNITPSNLVLTATTYLLSFKKTLDAESMHKGTLQKMLSRIYSKYWVKRCTHSDTK